VASFFGYLDHICNPTLPNIEATFQHFIYLKNRFFMHLMGKFESDPGLLWSYWGLATGGVAAKVLLHSYTPILFADRITV
jgi:hypothetical protein